MADAGLAELNARYRAFEKMPHGKERIAAIEEAVKRADEIGNLSWRLANRYNLIYEMAFHGDEGQILPVIAEYASLYEENPMPRYKRGYLYVLYLSLNQWECLPQLPLDERAKAEERFLNALMRYGGNQTEYHEKLYYRCKKEGKAEEAEHHYQEGLALAEKEPSMVSGCKACFQSLFYVDHAIWKKDWEEALKQAAPILDGTLKCEQHPRETYSDLLEFALDRGDRKQADRFAALLRSRLEQEGEEDFSDLMRYLAFSAPEEGLDILARSLPDMLKAWDQSERFDFFVNAEILCTQAARKFGRISLRLPDTFPLYREDDQYDLSALAEWFHCQAAEIAMRFDRRNGYPYYQKIIDDNLEGMRRMEEK